MKKFMRSSALTAVGLLAAVGISLVPSGAQADTGWPTFVQDTPSHTSGIVTDRRGSIRPLDTGWPI
ncbi:MAG: hypothetical protein L0H31_13695 [Nocardioidaceae bacterium]|nr:hypothetical protein [Nocardioidaceae bacterium]